MMKNNNYKKARIKTYKLSKKEDILVMLSSNAIFYMSKLY